MAEEHIALLSQCTERLAAAPDGIVHRIPQAIHVNLRPPLGYVSLNAHQARYYMQQIQPMHIRFEARLADVLHQLLVLHVLLDELDDEFFGFHGLYIEIQYKFISYYTILQ